jgi:hypothetical protein
VISLPFGVADLAAGIGVFRRLPVGIDAVDLSSGRRLWTSPEKALPIAIKGKRVLAKLFTDDANVLELIVLDAGDGRVVARSAPIGLPHPVTTRSPGFTVRADGMDGRFRVQWFAPARYAGGAPPPQAIIASQSDTAGIFEIDAETAAVVEAGAHAIVAPETAAPSLQLKLTPDYVVVARDASGAELWRYPLGQPSAARPPLRP